MVKPTDSTSPHRPIKKASEGRVVTIKAKILTAGHVSSMIQIGAHEFRIGNAALREVSGAHDL